MAEPDAWTRIARLELSRAPAEELAPYLGLADHAQVARAARALGQLHDEAAVALLLPLLSSSSPEIRREAAFGLGHQQDVAGALQSALGSEEDPWVQATLLDALGRCGTTEDVAALRAFLGGGDAGLAATASRALGRLGVRGELRAPPPGLLGLLLDELAVLDLDRRRAAAFALARTRPADLSPTQDERLARASERQPDPIARAWLVRASASGLAEASWNALAQVAVDDAAIGVRVALARGLTGRSEAPPADIVPRLLADPDRAVRVAAVGAASSLPWDDAMEAPLQALLDIRDPDMQARCLPLLASAGRLAEAEGWFNPTVDSSIRAAMIRSLDDPARLLEYATEDRSQAVRTAAAETLVSLDPAAPTELLTELLHQPDPVVAGLVAYSLAEAGHPALPALAAELLEERSGHEWTTSMLDALDMALQTSGADSLDDSTRARLVPLVDELQEREDPGLRRAARRVGEQLGLEPGDAPLRASLPDTEQLSALLGARVLTNRGEFAMSFHPSLAPDTCWRFVERAESGFYDGLAFHRIVPDFVVQGGDPRGDGYGGPGYSSPDELSPAPYQAWSVGMATSGPDTAGSQFFVALSPQPHLDGDYTLFGQVVQGQDVLMRLRQGDVIESVLIERRRAAGSWAPSSRP